MSTYYVTAICHIALFDIYKVAIILLFYFIDESHCLNIWTTPQFISVNLIRNIMPLESESSGRRMRLTVSVKYPRKTGESNNKGRPIWAHAAKIFGFGSVGCIGFGPSARQEQSSAQAMVGQTDAEVIRGTEERDGAEEEEGRRERLLDILSQRLRTSSKVLSSVYTSIKLWFHWWITLLIRLELSWSKHCTKPSSLNAVPRTAPSPNDPLRYVSDLNHDRE